MYTNLRMPANGLADALFLFVAIRRFGWAHSDFNYG